MPEALLHFSHEGDRPSVTMAALAEETNAILSRKGHRLLISPENSGLETSLPPGSPGVRWEWKKRIVVVG
jgi:hypothetical protein